MPEYFLHCLPENPVVLPEYYLIFLPEYGYFPNSRGGGGGLQPPSPPPPPPPASYAYGFNSSTFEPIISSLKSLDIMGNILVCNCELSWLMKYFGESLLHGEKTICSPPLLLSSICEESPSQPFSTHIVVLMFILSYGSRQLPSPSSHCP